MFREFHDTLVSIKARDPAARSLWEVALLYPGVRALVLYRIAHALWTMGLQFLARFVSELGRFLSGIEIHPGATIGRRLFIDHGLGVVIGETAVIGDDVTMYHGVTLGGMAATQKQSGRRHPTIEDGVIIGAGAQVLGPVTVGRGARVGANAVALKDVPPGVTVVGIPAQVAVARTATPSFTPYGTCDESADPTAKAIYALMSEIHRLEERLAQVEAERDSGDDLDRPEYTSALGREG
jgi:serine O-acetyltransferase